MTTAKYTLDDCGCYADGVYCIDAILSFAEDHGFELEPLDDGEQYPEPLSDYEWSDEVEDDIDEYMNNTYPVDDAYWGRNDNGDWGLWAIEDDE